MAVMAATACAGAQAPSSAAASILPDSPQPTIAPDLQSGSSSGESSSQDHVQPANPSAPQTDDQRAKAREQIKQQEKQRLLGVVPMFNTSYVSDAVSLTAKEKIKLAFRSAVDPVSFAGPALVAGIGELNAPAKNNGFGWGADGYAKKWGAAYLDSLSGTMIGNGFLPALLRQDPRYFRLGKGSGGHRMLYAMGTAVMTRHDNSRRWEPNYSNVGGNLIAGALSNLYYPSSPDNNGGWEQTITSALMVTAEGAAGAIFQEFWPDISRKVFHKDPTHGLDDKAKAAEAGEPKKQSDKPKQPIAPAPK
jgi:hypothetical protein